VRIACSELEQPVYVAHGISAAPNAKVWVAIRPEKVQLSLKRPEGNDNWTHGIVKEIAYMGDMSVFLIKLASGKQLRVTRPNMWRHDDENITWEQEVYLHWHDTSPVVITA
jgi:putrescine transport system ATP-binding protein